MIGEAPPHHARRADPDRDRPLAGGQAVIAALIYAWAVLALIVVARGAVSAFDAPIELKHDDSAPDPTAPGGGS